MNSTISFLLILIPVAPLLSALATAALGPRLLKERAHWPTIVAFVISCVAALGLLVETRGEAMKAPSAGGFEQIVTVAEWVNVDSAIKLAPNSSGPSSAAYAVKPLRLAIELRADPLTAVMLTVVTFISLLVAIYSIGYMHGERGYWRFFSYVSLFVFSMTMLVSASSFALLYVGWELVGLCSYLLIGFWYQKPEAAAAGKKAFLVNRIGDVGFALGLFLLWTTYGTLDFHDSTVGGVVSSGILGASRWTMPEPFVGGGLGTAICLLLLMGACGKSAQFPLHVWLPDAMEGPTPVSALIHAATMVTAGVYMLARCMPLFAVSPDALHVVALLGGATALIGAFVAITQTDLKRVLAYSTISHLGYMFIAMGVGTAAGAVAGMFHLVTHAFFKALLFLCAGSVMHAMGGVIDMRQFGGLRKKMPVTHWTFLFGALAMVGMIPFAGFFSKDAILVALAEKAADSPPGDWVYQGLYWSTFLGIILIAVYSFRPFFLTFYGPERIPKEAGHHAHESPKTMTVPLMILAVGSLVVGAALEWTHALGDLLARTPSFAYLLQNAHHAEHDSNLHYTVAAQSTGMVVLGLALTFGLFAGSQGAVKTVKKFFRLVGLYQLSWNKLFFDPIYDLAVVAPTYWFARCCAWFDQYVVDGLVNFVGFVPNAIGRILRPTQAGLVPYYALAMTVGLLAIISLLLL